MIALILAPFYIGINVYLVWRIVRWLKTLHPLFLRRSVSIVIIALYAILTLCPIAGAFAGGHFKTVAQAVFNHWLGTLMYFVLFLVLADLCKLILRLAKRKKIRPPVSEEMLRIRGSIILVLSVVISFYGFAHAYDTKTTHYDVTIDKPTAMQSLKIALVSDLHLGSNVGVTHVEKMKSIIDDMNPDIVVYAGDIFDNDYDMIDDPERIIDILKSIDSKYGSYACWGNHDIQEVILAGFTFDTDEEKTADTRMEDFLESAGINLLEDETVLINHSFYLTGRRDKSVEFKSSTDRMTPQQLFENVNDEYPIIVIDHQPAQLEELAQAGADLTLSGHTHDGQYFPVNLIVDRIWDNSCGMTKVGNMTDIVTSGIGMWGPAMRVATDSEVVEIDVKFAG